MFKTKKDHYISLLWIAIILFVTLFSILSFNNRLAADDLYYLANYPKVGIWGCMEYLYQSFSGRWSAYLFTGTVVSVSHLKCTLFIFHTFTLISLIAVTSFILHQILNIRLHFQLKKHKILLYAMITTMGLFFASYSIGETWFWVVQVCTYLWSIIMSLVLIYTFLNKKFARINYLIIIVVSVFIGGASESYALINLFLLMGFLFFANVNYTKLRWLKLSTSKSLNSKLLVALLAMLIGFIITMLAPGNGVRFAALPHPSEEILGWIQLKSFIKITFVRTPLSLPILLLFGTPWFILGNQLQKEEFQTSFIHFAKSAFPFISFFLALIFIFLIPTSFIMAELGPDRSLSLVSFFITLSFSSGLFWVGYVLPVGDKIIHSLKIGIPLIMIALLSYQTAKQYQITADYAHSYDARNHQLETLKREDVKSAIILDSLNPSGMLYSAEITINPTHFVNQFLKNASGVKCDIAVKNK